MNDSPIGVAKEKLRAEIKKRKLLMTPTEKANEAGKLAARVVKETFWQQAKNVAAYYPMRSELDVLPLAEAALQSGKKLFFPVVKGNNLEWRKVPSLEPSCFTKGAFGIMEPIGEKENLKLEETLWLVPGVAFTEDCRRLGRGGGYYDRVLSEFPAEKRETVHFLGVAFACQLVSNLPTEEWDRKLDAIATFEKTIIAIDDID